MNPTSQLLMPEVSELIARRDFRALRESLTGVPPADVADLLTDLPLEQAAVTFRLLPRDEAGDVFAELDADLQTDLIDQLGDIRSRQAIEALEPDDRARVLDELPTEVATRLIASLSPATRRETQAILGYDYEMVGRLMTPDYVRVRPEWTVARALEHIRKFGRDAETVHWIFVVDSKQRLVDDLRIRQLLVADPGMQIKELMDDAFQALDAHEDREEAVRMMARYDRTALPVIDSRGVLLGIVTHDDVADVAEEEVTEDIQKQAGMEALDKPYMQTGLLEMVKARGIWLCILLILQVATIGVLDMFQSHLAQAAILVSFIPLIISSGGNTGTQAASLLIRAISLEEIEHKDWARIIARELRTGLVLGALLGVLAFAIVVTLNAAGIVTDVRATRVGLTIGLSILGIVLWGVTIGSMFPIILDRIGLDPATISSPLVATLMDVSGLVIYLACASILIL
ncbi:MAG: magnesium transporter [Phycisphaerales bacterium]|nr:magnesium transporter [Phycisphaerales bacterium]